MSGKLAILLTWPIALFKAMFRHVSHKPTRNAGRRYRPERHYMICAGLARHGAAPKSCQGPLCGIGFGGFDRDIMHFGRRYAAAFARAVALTNNAHALGMHSHPTTLSETNTQPYFWC